MRSIDLRKISIDVERDDESIDITALHDGYPVGRALCTLTGDRLCIDDLAVGDRVHIPWPVAHVLLVRWGFRPRTRSYRKHGIGSLLLGRVVEVAREVGAREVWGSVVAGGIDETPGLLEWYRRRGFTISPADSEGMPRAVNKIVLVLGGRPASHEGTRLHCLLRHTAESLLGERGELSRVAVWPGGRAGRPGAIV